MSQFFYNCFFLFYTIYLCEVLNFEGICFKNTIGKKIRFSAEVRQQKTNLKFYMLQKSPSQPFKLKVLLLLNKETETSIFLNFFYDLYIKMKNKIKY